MLSETYLLTVHDLKVLAILKEMVEKGKIELSDYWPEVTRTEGLYTADAY